jgi:16S rRNA (uracil1498-N3)-methyltransferase
MPHPPFSLTAKLGMTIPRFYCPVDLGDRPQLKLPHLAAHHAAKVLRLQRGERVTLFNGAGGEFEASVHLVSKDSVVVDVGKYLRVERESPLRVCLAQALAGGDKMDWILQKAVELGVACIQPLVAERSVVRLSGERAEKRERHWRNVVIAACEQCGRNSVPEVAPLMEFTTWLASAAPGARKLMLAPEAQSGLRELPRPEGEVILLAGPEGGFSEAEKQTALTRAFSAVHLGPRVLRTETVALAALSAMQTLWGDFV